jgi:hypothetical protein
MMPGAGPDEPGFDVDPSLPGVVVALGAPPGGSAGAAPAAQREPAAPRDTAARDAQREAQREQREHQREAQREAQREPQRHGAASKESATDVRLGLDRLTHTHEASLGEPNGYPPQVRERIVYTLAPSFVPGGRTALLRAFQLRFKKDGGRAKPTPYPLAQLAVSDARFVLGIDREIGPGHGGPIVFPDDSRRRALPASIIREGDRCRVVDHRQQVAMQVREIRKRGTRHAHQVQASQRSVRAPRIRVVKVRIMPAIRPKLTPMLWLSPMACSARPVTDATPTRWMIHSFAPSMGRRMSRAISNGANSLKSP